MHKELITIELIRNSLARKKILSETTSNIDEIYNFFKKASQSKNSDFHYLYILNYIFNFISSDKVSKRKTSSRVFEDLLAIIFNGDIADDVTRENNISIVPDSFQNVKDKIAGNKREKADLIFNRQETPYSISVKTLVQENTEINMGSFEKQVLYDGLGVESYLNERKATNKEKIGLGSRSQLQRLFKFLQKNNIYNNFEKKFSEMVRFIFDDDMILAIKNDSILEMYFIKGNDFVNLLTSRANNPDQLLTVVNRWEGNSIRINRKHLIENTIRKVVLDFNILDKTVIKNINDFDLHLHQSYLEYFDADSKRTEVREEILAEFEELFDKFNNELGI